MRAALVLAIVAACDAGEPSRPVATSAPRPTAKTVLVDAAPPEEPSEPGEPSEITGRVLVDAVTAIHETPQLTRDMLEKKVAQAYLPALRRCYDAVLATNPIARGKIALQLVVGDTGRVLPASRVTAAFDESVKTCVAHLITTWRFPLPGTGDATFELAFVMTR